MVEGRTIPLEAGGDDVLIAKDPAATADAFVFRRKRSSGGAGLVGRDRVRPRRRAAFNVAFTAPTSAAVAALTGRYENDDPWRGGFTILAQGETLFAEGADPLVPLPGGGYRVGDKDWSPDRISFDAVEDGCPQRAVASGVDYLRRSNT